jgi:hypothetical protein
MTSFKINNFSQLQILMTISSAGTSIFLLTLATYSYLNETGVDQMLQLSWIPIVSLSLAIFLASLGIIPLPYIIITELMPSKVKLSQFQILLLKFIEIHKLGQKRGMHNMHVLSNVSLLHCSEGICLNLINKVNHKICIVTNSLYRFSLRWSY